MPERRVVEHDDLHRQVQHLHRDELAQQHRQPAVAGHRDDVPAAAGQGRADRVRERVGHGPVQERADHAALAVRRDVPGGPDVAHAGVDGEDGVVGRLLVQQHRGVLGVDRLGVLDVLGVRADHAAHRALVLLEHLVEEPAALLRRHQAEEGLGGLADVPEHHEVVARAPPEPRRLDVDLRGADARRQELVVREVGAQQQQQVRTLHRRLARAVPEQARTCRRRTGCRPGCAPCRAGCGRRARAAPGPARAPPRARAGRPPRRRSSPCRRRRSPRRARARRPRREPRAEPAGE